MTEIMSNSLNDVQHQRLMELVEAEDAASGEVGCGRDWGSKLPVYLQTCHINVSDEALRALLREYLAPPLEERDFDRIVEAVRSFIETIVVDAHLQGLSEKNRTFADVPEHIPTVQLTERFQQDLGDICSSIRIEQIVQFTHQTINRTVLNPRHTWLPPTWVLTDEKNFYVVQSARAEDAIVQAKQQYPEVAEVLRIVQVSNIIAQNQVLKIEPLP
jgi:hypothetical protein